MAKPIESEVEKRVIALLAAAFEDVDGVRIEGAWQTAAEGEVKGEESPTDRVVVGVAVGAPSFDTYQTPTAEIPVALAIVVRRELAPTADALAETVGRVSDVLLRLQVDAPDALSSARFRADGVRLDAGEPPVFNVARNVWSVARSFTVKGGILI